jgi:D-aminoacyl-tRNA deacylase
MWALVASEADEASVNQRAALLEAAAWEPDGTFEGRPAYRLGALRLLTIREHHLYRDHVDRDVARHAAEAPELVVFLSKHRAESRAPSLTVHPIGNPAGASYGGRPGVLVPSAPGWMTGALRALRLEARGLPYNVTFEATHHGPYLETPTFFIEQGSTEEQWADPAASRAIAKALLRLGPADGPVGIGLGGGHYVPRHTDVALERRVAFGHLLPAYALDSAGEGVLDEAIRKTSQAEVAYVHRKSLPRADVRRWEERLEARGLRIVREADLEPLDEAKVS